MNDATLNIRLNPTLKQHGAEVLRREGLTVTQAVRALYEYMEENQTLPPDLLKKTHQSEDKCELRRNLMRSMIGILPTDASLTQAKEARLARHGL